VRNPYAEPRPRDTQSFLTTTAIPSHTEFTSSAVATWDTGLGGAFSPHGVGTGYVYSDRGDISYKRLVKEIDVPATGDQALEFYVSYDTEPAWDFIFVEARTPDGTDYVTLPDANLHTSNSTGDSCPRMHELHSDLPGADLQAGWNAASGRSAGWELWSVDLSDWAGSNVEVSISYVSDWAVQGIGAFVDDIDAPGAVGDADFEGDLDGWTVMDGTTFPEPTDSDPNPNNFTRPPCRAREARHDDAIRRSLRDALPRLRVRGDHRRERPIRRDGPSDGVPGDPVDEIHRVRTGRW
jgi:hypothetical protein